MVDWSWRWVVVMADGVSGIGSAPFNVGSEIHQQTQARERIAPCGAACRERA